MPPIAVVYTASAGIAIAVNSWFLGRASGWSAGVTARDLRRLARGFVLVWSLLVLEDFVMFVAGAGILSGARALGYLLALVPLLSIAVGFAALRSFE